MKHLTQTNEQSIINRINSMIDFTYPNNTLRYIVGCHSLHQSINPSIQYSDIYKDVHSIVKSLNNNDNDMTTIGGWLDKETNIYYVDLGIQYNNLDEAIKFAKDMNEIAIYDTVNNKEIRI